MGQTDEPKRLGAFLDQLFPGKKAAFEGWVPLLKGWPQFVGENLSYHTRAREIQGGNLLVDVDHPAWMNQFLMQKDGILERIQRESPQLQIKGIRLRLVADLQKPPQEPRLPEAEKEAVSFKPSQDLKESLDKLKSLLNQD